MHPKVKVKAIKIRLSLLNAIVILGTFLSDSRIVKINTDVLFFETGWLLYIHVIKHNIGLPVCIHSTQVGVLTLFTSLMKLFYLYQISASSKTFQEAKRTVTGIINFVKRAISQC